MVSVDMITFAVLGFFCFNTLTPSDAAETHDTCRHGWLSWKNSCFMFSTDKTTWQRAEEICRLYGGHLVEIHDAEKNNYVKDHLRVLHYNDHNNQYWMGLTDVSSTWEWLMSGSLISYNDWYRNQPQHNSEHCACFNGQTSFQWHDYPCSAQENFICEGSQF